MSGLNRQDGHCSDEVLIRYLDLELPSAERERVAAHLGLCWQCRASLAGLESAIHRVASLSRDDRFVAPERAAAAKRKFLESVAPMPHRVQTARVPGRWLWAGAAAAAAIIVVAGIALRPKAPGQQAAPVSAASVTEQVRAAEAVAIPQGPAVVQTFRFEARELAPPQRHTEASLEIWSETATHQMGVRWMDSRAMLVSASLRSTRPSTSAQPLGWSMTARDVEWDALDELLSAELTNRSGPLLLVSEFLAFCRYAGVQPVMETSRPRLLLSATHRSGERTIRFWIEADPGTLQPLRQGITMRDPKQGFEVVLEPKGRTTARRIDPARFVVRKPAVRTDVPDPAPPPSTPPAPVALLPLPEETEIEVRYALHRSRQPSDGLVVRPAASGGQVEVRGVVAGAAHRDELEAALALAGLRDRVAWRVQVSPQDTGKLPAPVSPERAVSRALHAQVWELAQIAERYDEASAARLSARSRRLLATIVQEKLGAVDAEANQLRTALGEPAGNRTDPPAAAQDWQAQVFALYRSAAALDSLVETQPGKPLLVRLLDSLQQTARGARVGEVRP
jgi:hypothetical protein